MDYPEESLNGQRSDMKVNVLKVASDVVKHAKELYDLTEFKDGFSVYDLDVDLAEYMADPKVKDKVDQGIKDLQDNFTALNGMKNYSNELVQVVTKVFEMANKYKNQQFKLIYTFQKLNSILEPEENSTSNFHSKLPFLAIIIPTVADLYFTEKHYTLFILSRILLFMVSLETIANLNLNLMPLYIYALRNQFPILPIILTTKRGNVSIFNTALNILSWTDLQEVFPF